jgi:hypothetical protein
LLTVPEASSIYCLRIEILDSDPPIWRQFCADSELSLQRLHLLLAEVMGWAGTADYRFKVPPRAGQAALDLTAVDATTCSLTLKDLVAQVGDSFSYTYAPVQGWIHTVTLESLQPPEADLEVPQCLAGEQACPPEFCDGIWGYEELLDRLGDPDDPESDGLWEKIGYDFDPNWFNLKDVNQRLQRFR